MFERYTEQARRMIFFARYEASQYGSRYIEVPHLLLGLIREDFSTFRVLSDVDRPTLQKAVEELCSHSGQKVPTSVDLPLSKPCQQVLSSGAREAGRMGHQHIGPEHLLLGVLLENGLETGVLARYGIELESARESFRGSATKPAEGPESVANRRTLELLLAHVPEDRLVAAARILAGLSSGYFAVGGISSEGPFSFSFGTAPGS
jgi:ATP-dependent Clp protease ATP-binding subunit ClpC